MDKDIHEKLDRARSMASDTLKRATSGIREGAGQLGERVRAAGTQAAPRISDARMQAGKAVDQANRLITEHPIAAAAVAAAAGAAAAWLLPKKARKAAIIAPPRLLDAAGDKVRKTLDSASSRAKDAFDNSREIAAGAARRAENGARAAQDNLRSAASKAVKRADEAELDARARRLIDAAAGTAAKVIAKVRQGGRNDASGE